MENMQATYNGEFTIEERKAMTAQVLQELRKARKMSQKEVAGHLNIPATTYNTYESGRTEPPIEMLVRLSYLYELPVDVIVRRNRLPYMADDENSRMTEYTQEQELMREFYQIDTRQYPSIGKAIEELKKVEELSGEARDLYQKMQALYQTAISQMPKSDNTEEN